MEELHRERGRVPQGRWKSSTGEVEELQRERKIVPQGRWKSSPREGESSLRYRKSFLGKSFPGKGKNSPWKGKSSLKYGKTCPRKCGRAPQGGELPKVWEKLPMEGEECMGPGVGGEFFGRRDG